MYIVCATCGNEVECSPGMARYGLEGKGLCVACDNAGRVGRFVPKED